MNFKICVNPNAKPQRESGEYIFFLVSISFALGPTFQWNMGLRLSVGECTVNLRRGQVKIQTNCRYLLYKGLFGILV